MVYVGVGGALQQATRGPFESLFRSSWDYTHAKKLRFGVAGLLEPAHSGPPKVSGYLEAHPQWSQHGSIASPLFLTYIRSLPDCRVNCPGFRRISAAATARNTGKSPR